MSAIAKYGMFLYFLSGIPVYSEEGTWSHKLEVAYSTVSVISYWVTIGVSVYMGVSVWLLDSANLAIQYYWTVDMAFNITALVLFSHALVNRKIIVDWYEKADNLGQSLRLEYGALKTHLIYVMKILLIAFFVIWPPIDFIIVFKTPPYIIDFGVLTITVLRLARITSIIFYWATLLNQTVAYVLESEWLEAVFTEVLMSDVYCEEVPGPGQRPESEEVGVPGEPDPFRVDYDQAQPGTSRTNPVLIEPNRYSVLKIRKLLQFYSKIKHLRLEANQQYYFPVILLMLNSILFYPLALIEHEGTRADVLGGVYVGRSLLMFFALLCPIAFNQFANFKKHSFASRVGKEMYKNVDPQIRRMLKQFADVVKNRFEDSPFILFDLDFGVLAMVLNSAFLVLTTFFAKQQDT